MVRSDCKAHWVEHQTRDSGDMGLNPSLICHYIFTISLHVVQYLPTPGSDSKVKSCQGKKPDQTEYRRQIA